MRCWTSGIRSPASEYLLDLKVERQGPVNITFVPMLVVEEKAEDDDEHEESLGRRAA